MSGSSAGMTVSVAGTSLTTTVDTNDAFTLKDVPAGDVDLQFTGAGMSSTVALGTIHEGDHASVTVRRNGASMSLDCIRLMGGAGEELEGLIDGLPPTTPAGTFTVSGQNVQTDANTTFLKGNAPATFADLQIGQRVHVKGTPNASGVLAASVRIQNVNTDAPVHLEGLIADFSGTATAFQFTVNGHLVMGDATTVFEEGTVFANLVNGAHVEVKGVLGNGFVQATRIEVE